MVGELTIKINYFILKMSNIQNIQIKRKNICDKDIQDFFFIIEDKLEKNQSKIDQFTDVIREFNAQK